MNPDLSFDWARNFSGGYPFSITQTMDGGYAVAANDGNDFLVLKLGPDGNYPGCVQDCSPTVMTVSPSTSTPSVGADCSPSTSTPTLTVTTPTPTITDACEPVALEETDLAGLRPRITCSPVPGGALFLSPDDIEIRIYAADGRLAYSGNLEKGENLISLETGAYLWRAGAYRGKVAVK